MVAVRTKFFAKDLPDNLDRLRNGIERRIPLGAGAGNKKLNRHRDHDGMPDDGETRNGGHILCGSKKARKKFAYAVVRCV
jgi:hypothetical protein